MNQWTHRARFPRKFEKLVKTIPPMALRAGGYNADTGIDHSIIFPALMKKAVYFGDLETVRSLLAEEKSFVHCQDECCVYVCTCHCFSTQSHKQVSGRVRTDSVSRVIRAIPILLSCFSSNLNQMKSRFRYDTSKRSDFKPIYKF